VPRQSPKVYRGLRKNGRPAVIVDTGERFRMLRHRVLRSPSGMEWGYGGSGPADLALSILADCTGNLAYAERFHQQFKFDVVARLPQDGFSLSEDEVRAWVEQHPVTPEELDGWGEGIRDPGPGAANPIQQAAEQLGSPSNTCHRCHRVLRSAKARQRGYGQVCWGKTLADLMRQHIVDERALGVGVGAATATD